MSTRPGPPPIGPCNRCGHPHDPRKCRGHVDLEDGTLRPCGRYPLRGAAVCDSHGAATRHVREAAARRVALGEMSHALEKLGTPIDTTPTDAMLDMVREAAGNVAFYRSRVQELDQLLAGPQGEDILAILGGGGEGGREVSANAPAAIYGRVDPRNWRAERHVLVGMYDEEREKLVRWSKMCRDAGVEEARVQLAEEQGHQLAQVIRATVAALLELAVSAVGDKTGGELVAVLQAAWAERVPGIVREQILTVTASPSSGVAV